MNEAMPLRVIAVMRSDFPDKFGVPRQSGMVEELVSTVVFRPGYRNADALRGLDDFSHIWLIWGFSKAEREGWSPTVRRGSAGTGAWGCLPPVRPSARMLSGCRPFGYWRWNGAMKMALFCGSRGLI